MKLLVSFGSSLMTLIWSPFSCHLGMTFSQILLTCDPQYFQGRIPFTTEVAERLAPPTSDHVVVGSNPAGDEILPEPNLWRFIAQSLSSSPFHRPEMTEILMKGRKTLTHPSLKWEF